MATVAHQQLRKPRGTFVTEKTHPSWGGNAYSLDVRAEIITRWQLGLPLNTIDLNELRAVYSFPSLQTCIRWVDQYNDVGHYRPKIATGNHEALREVLGLALVRLALYRVVHPEAKI